MGVFFASGKKIARISDLRISFPASRINILLPGPIPEV